MYAIFVSILERDIFRSHNNWAEVNCTPLRNVIYILVINPQSIAIPKLRNVPANTYSVFAVSVSLNRKIDLAATIKPIASNCPSNTKMMVSIRSKLPINAPAFLCCRKIPIHQLDTSLKST